MTLIDKDAIYETLEREYKRTKGDTHSAFRECLNYICDAPTIDTTKIIKCVECIHQKDCHQQIRQRKPNMSGTGFDVSVPIKITSCSHGEHITTKQI